MIEDLVMILGFGIYVTVILAVCYGIWNYIDPYGAKPYPPNAGPVMPILEHLRRNHPDQYRQLQIHDSRQRRLQRLAHRRA